MRGQAESGALAAICTAQMQAIALAAGHSVITFPRPVRLTNDWPDGPTPCNNP